MELIPKEDVYQIHKGDHHSNLFSKLPYKPDQPPVYVSSKKQLPVVAQVFFGGASLIGLYIVYRLLDDSNRRK